MQKKLLVLLTSVFPYDSGEEFLEVELPYLAASFTRVIILPVHQLNPKKSGPTTVAFGYSFSCSSHCTPNLSAMW